MLICKMFTSYVTVVLQDRDPFIEDPEAEHHIGTVKVWLQSLAYNIEIKEQLEITDYKGSQVRAHSMLII